MVKIDSESNKSNHTVTQNFTRTPRQYEQDARSGSSYIRNTPKKQQHTEPPSMGGIWSIPEDDTISLQIRSKLSIYKLEEYANKYITLFVREAICKILQY